MLARATRIVIVIAVGISAAVMPATANAGGPAPTHASAKEKQQAQSHFTRGKDLYDKGKLEPALAQLNLSFDAVSSPNTRLYISRCLRDLGRLVPAYAEYGHTATDAKELGDHYQKTAQVALDERAQLEKNLGLIEIRVLHPAVTTRLNVAQADVPRNEWTDPVAVVPGSIAVVVETTGQPPIKKTIDVAAGEKKSLAIDVEPPPPQPPPPEPVAATAQPAASEATKPAESSSTAAMTTAPGSDTASSSRYRVPMYISGGVAVAGLTTFIIAGALANSTYSDLERACGSGPCPQGQGFQSDVDSGKTEQTVANLGLAVFVIGAAVAVTMFVLDMRAQGTRQQQPSQKGAQAKASAARTFRSLGYSW